MAAPGTRVEATGHSATFELREAFEDAIRNLPPDTHNFPDKLTQVRVEEIGAELGGIAGLRRMFVRISANR